MTTLNVHFTQVLITGKITISYLFFSEKAIEQSRKLVNSSRPGLRFELADAFNLRPELDRLGLNDKVFNCVIDKGTLDAIDNGKQNVTKIIRYFDQIDSVLSLFGRYILVTLAQDHIIKHIADYFLDELVTIHFVICSIVEILS